MHQCLNYSHNISQALHFSIILLIVASSRVINRVQFYCIDVNNVPHKLVVRAGVTVSLSYQQNYFNVVNTQ